MMAFAKLRGLIRGRGCELVGLFSHCRPRYCIGPKLRDFIRQLTDLHRSSASSGFEFHHIETAA